MEEKIEDLLNTHLLCPYTPFGLTCYQKAAAETARLIGQREAELGHEIELLNEEVDWHKVKLAEMREALSGAKHSFARIAHGENLADEYEMMHFAQKCFEKADELLAALSAAPEVKNGRED